MTRIFLLSVLLSSAAVAQPSTPTPIVFADARTSTSSYAGLYATDGGMIEVRPGTSGITLIAHGAPVAARLTGLSSSDTHTDAHAAALLDAWVTGDLEAVVTSVRSERQFESAESFARYRSALVRGHGDAIAASVVGTFDSIYGGQVTLVQLLFDRGSEWASLVWDENDELVTMTRGLSPVVVGTAEPTSRDTFTGTGTDTGTGTEVRFERGQDGRVETIRVDDRFVAIR
ncbi:hypothetical protein [Rubrivirga sp.]|uniref:hypothetical protein n=1 Tax=Rubrivirga sp. TaxID=1885344 RepID=UPI003C7913E1